MNETHSTPSRSTGTAMLISLIGTVFVTLAVNAQIYSSRWEFAAFYPEKAADRPSTISESIADPRIGEPFANWLLVCAPMLFVAVVLLAYPPLRSIRAQQALDTRLMRRILVCTWLLLVLQAMACVGMVILSQYRFPHFRDEHMAGSYLFFFSQAFVVVVGEVLSRSYVALGPEGQVPGRLMSLRYAAWRRNYVWVPIVLGVVYLCLFLGKGYAPDTLRYFVYNAYVSTELFLLSAFLFYVVTYVPDMWAIYRASRSGQAVLESTSSAS